MPRSAHSCRWWGNQPDVGEVTENGRVDYVDKAMAGFDRRAAFDGPALAWASVARRTVSALRTRSTTAQADAFVLEAERVWDSDNPEPAVLERLRVQVWRYLDTKNGNSTTIVDAEDKALRCLIGMLFPFTTRDNVADTVEWSEQMGLARSTDRQTMPQCAQSRESWALQPVDVVGVECHRRGAFGCHDVVSEPHFNGVLVELNADAVHAQADWKRRV